MSGFLAACFRPGTLLDSGTGWKPIESFQKNDPIAARSDADVSAPVEIKQVEEVFVRTGRIANLHIGDELIETMAEHPFWVKGKGWVRCGDLQKGDLLAGRDGEWTPIEEVYDTGEYGTVYNLRVSDHHTYFVGGRHWGFSVWVHNFYAAPMLTPEDIPTFNSGQFDQWFDKQTPEQLREYWKDPALRKKIDSQLLSGGGKHEYLLRSMAPKWKEWGITAKELREKFSVAFDELDKVARFKHSRGTLGSAAPGSKEAHNELQKILQKSKTLEDFKKNLVPWAKKWLKGGAMDLPTALQTSRLSQLLGGAKNILGRVSPVLRAVGKVALPATLTWEALDRFTKELKQQEMLTLTINTFAQVQDQAKLIKDRLKQGDLSKEDLVALKEELRDMLRLTYLLTVKLGQMDLAWPSTALRVKPQFDLGRAMITSIVDVLEQIDAQLGH